MFVKMYRANFVPAYKNFL